MFRFRAKRVKARKILLDKCDVIVFRKVPDFIVDSFFGECNYYKRLIVCSFSFLNGISFFQLITLLQWKQLSDLQKKNKWRHYWLIFTSHIIKRSIILITFIMAW